MKRIDRLMYMYDYHNEVFDETVRKHLMEARNDKNKKR